MIRVLDLSVIIFGPATADFLGELGAEVIKVEMPGQGDVTRILGHAGCFWKDVSVAFFPQNHGKYHVGVDMHHPDGQALMRKLAARSDVLVENFKPGTTEAKWGLGYRQLRELNPRLIYVANTGFGQWGPFAEGRASYRASREVRERLGGMDIAVSVYTVIPVKDGWAFIAGYTDPNFGAICRIMERPDLAQDPRFRTTLDRTQPDKRAALRDEIARWSINYTASEILAKVLADPGPGTVVFGPVNRPTQTLAEDHWWDRACFARLDDPVYGLLTLAAPAWRMTRTPPRLKIPGRPTGFHTAHVYARHLGLGPARLAELRARGII